VSAGAGANWIARRVRVGFEPELLVDRKMKDGRVAATTLAKAQAGETVKIWTGFVKPTMATRLAVPRAILAAKIRLMGTPS
jgi:hypothetical protein